MGVIGLSLGCAAAASFAFVMATDRGSVRHPDAVILSAVMVLIWGISMISDGLLAPPESKLLNPVLDAAFAVGAGWAWLTRREGWKIALLVLLAVQSLSHVVYQTEYRQAGVLWSYTLVLNMTFLAELLCIMTPGASNVARWIGGVLRVHRDPHPHLGARL